MQHPYVVFRLMQPPIDLVRTTPQPIMYQDPNVPPTPERIEDPDKIVYEKCTDCGSEAELEDYHLEGYGNLRLCDVCQQERLRGEPHEPSFGNID